MTSLKKKNKDMEKDVRMLMDELKGLMGRTDPASVARMDEIASWLKDNRSPEVEKAWKDFSEQFLMKMEDDVADIKQQVLREQMDDATYKLIPWKYIAEKYFGKSQSWLAQRINGYSVRGHRYTLNEEQKETLNRALSEVGSVIGSYRVA